MNPPSEECRIFDQLWIIGTIVSVLAAIPACYWREQATWIMTAAVSVGVVIALIIEWRLVELSDWFPGLQTWNYDWH